MKKNVLLICILLIVCIGMTTVASAATTSFNLLFPGYGGYANTVYKIKLNYLPANATFTSYNGTMPGICSVILIAKGDVVVTNGYTYTTGTVNYMSYRSGGMVMEAAYKLRCGSNSLEWQSSNNAIGNWEP